MPLSYSQTSHKLANEGTSSAGAAIEKYCCSHFCTGSLEWLLCEVNEILQLFDDPYQSRTTFIRAPLQPEDRGVF